MMRRRLALALAALLLLQAPATIPAADFGGLILKTTPYAAISSISNLFTHDANNDAQAWVFQCTAAITVTQVKVMYGLRIGTPPTFAVSLQSVGTDGLASGTIHSAGGATVTFTPPADGTWNSTNRTFTLGSSYAVAKGEWIAVHLAYSSGTIDGSNSSSFATHSTGLSNNGTPYAYSINGGGAASRSAGVPVIAIGDGTTWCGYPVEAVATTTYSDATNPDERGLQWTLPASTCATYTVKGARVMGTTPAIGSTVTMRLTSGAGSDLQDAETIDTDYFRAAAQTSNQMVFTFSDTTLATLSAGTAYNISWQAGASAAFGIQTFDVDAANDLTAYPGGTAFVFATRDGGSGAFTPDTDTRPMVDLILGDCSGGSTIVRRGVVGG